MRSPLIAIVVLTTACAASPSAPTSNAATTASEREGRHGHHHQGDQHREGKPHEHRELPPALHDFHGVLAPVWHSEPGATRIEKACASRTSMLERARATGDAELVAAVQALEAACAKDGHPEVELKLAAVHDRFHAAAKIDKHDH